MMRGQPRVEISLNNHGAYPLLNASQSVAPYSLSMMQKKRLVSAVMDANVCQLRGILASARGHSVCSRARLL